MCYERKMNCKWGNKNRIFVVSYIPHIFTRLANATQVCWERIGNLIWARKFKKIRVRCMQAVCLVKSFQFKKFLATTFQEFPRTELLKFHRRSPIASDNDTNESFMKTRSHTFKRLLSRSARPDENFPTKQWQKREILMFRNTR